MTLKRMNTLQAFNVAFKRIMSSQTFTSAHRLVVLSLQRDHIELPETELEPKSILLKFWNTSTCNSMESRQIA